MQGKADATINNRIPHGQRGHMSPLGGGQPDPFLLHRDEDIASAKMTRQRNAKVPETNKRGFITPIKGRFPTDMSTD